MRKQDLKLDTPYAASRRATNGYPVILASLSEEFHLSRREVGRGNPTGRNLRSTRRSGSHPTYYLGVTYNESDPERSGEVAREVGAWLETLTTHHYTPVPDDLLPEEYRLVEVTTRDLDGEWFAVQEDKAEAEKARLARELVQDEREAYLHADFHALREVAKSFGLNQIRPGSSSPYKTDYAKAEIPVADLLTLLTSLKSEG